MGVLFLLVSLLVSTLIYAYKVLLPSFVIRRKLGKQGIGGPTPSLLYGNALEMKQIQAKASTTCLHKQTITHDHSSSIFPYFELWRKVHGMTYTYSTGTKQHLYIGDPEMVKEINKLLTLELGKPIYLTERLEPVFGTGITRSNGSAWAHQRKIIAPEMFLDKVKNMIGLIEDSTQVLVRKWEELVESRGGEAEIQVDDDLRNLSADIISGTCFGSSYAKGKEIFSKLRELQKLVTLNGLLFRFPTFRILPHENGRRMAKLRRETDTLIWDAVRERKEGRQDLMQRLLEEALDDSKTGGMSTKSFIVDNCKTMYLSGHESTAIAASWCLMLLALHPEWQTRVREEVSELCNGALDASTVSSLKTVTMVIQEAMRLYPPGAFVSREALAEVRIGRWNVPKGVCMWIFIPSLHTDTGIWGSDAFEFKPERFSQGVSQACKYPQAYVPFGLGMRQCLGKHLAMMELRVVISLIVSKFTFSLSPRYVHAPTFKMFLEPEHGVRIVVKKVG